MKTKKRILSLALAGALTLGLLPAFSSPALAADGDTSYTLTIPSTLTVANSGWNATDGISATGTLESGKKLTVTAASANSWALKSGSIKLGPRVNVNTEVCFCTQKKRLICRNTSSYLFLVRFSFFILLFWRYPWEVGTQLSSSPFPLDQRLRPFLCHTK